MKIRKRDRGKLTQAIIAQTRIVGRPAQTATEIAKTLEHDPAVVSGILNRLAKAGRVNRYTAQSLGHTHRKPETWVY